MYSCGPTVYRDAHLGNLRSYLMADWIRRGLQAQGATVEHVKNITDVGHMRQEQLEQGEDKVIAAAIAEGKTPAEIAHFYTDRFIRDERALNILPAGHLPKATDHIVEMVDVVLREGGNVHAYDPAAMAHVRSRFSKLACFDDPYAAAAGADVLVLMTEWNEFRNIDLPRIHQALGSARLLDCRNVYDPQEMATLGFDYVSVGRPRRGPEDEAPSVSDWMLPGRFAPVG